MKLFLFFYQRSSPNRLHCSRVKSIETSKLKKFREAGINRLSMGVQSLDAEDLRYLGRNHSVGDAERCFELARNVFDRVSFDLIYARHPDQTGHKWREELRKALKMGPTHLSLYSLTFEGGTPFHRALEQGKRTFLSQLSTKILHSSKKSVNFSKRGNFFKNSLFFLF